MNIRRLVLDVDKAKDQPSILEIAAAIDSLDGVEGANIAIDGIDMETIGMQMS